MIYVVARPDGTTERVNGRSALFAWLGRLGEADRASVTVSAGTVRLAGDKVYWALWNERGDEDGRSRRYVDRC